jgi:hypothetical protein
MLKILTIWIGCLEHFTSDAFATLKTIAPLAPLDSSGQPWWKLPKLRFLGDTTSLLLATLQHGNIPPHNYVCAIWLQYCIELWYLVSIRICAALTIILFFLHIHTFTTVVVCHVLHVPCLLFCFVVRLHRAFSAFPGHPSLTSKVHFVQSDTHPKSKVLFLYHTILDLQVQHI